MNSMEQEYAEADRELQFLGYEALDRCLKTGAREDDLKYIAWLAGLTDWKPDVTQGMD